MGLQGWRGQGLDEHLCLLLLPASLATCKPSRQPTKTGLREELLHSMSSCPMVPPSPTSHRLAQPSLCRADIISIIVNDPILPSSWSYCDMNGGHSRFLDALEHS